MRKRGKMYGRWNGSTRFMGAVQDVGSCVVEDTVMLRALKDGESARKSKGNVLNEQG